MRLLETRQVIYLFILDGAAGIIEGTLPPEVDNADKTRRRRFDEGKVRPLIMIANRALRRRPVLRPPPAFFLFRFALFLPSELALLSRSSIRPDCKVITSHEEKKRAVLQQALSALSTE